ncbi:MAG: soluble lytic murein transglycosylase-like protein [Cellvibrionaceae bacterium]|jgi:soluble lytic murein transglycosylase-like protein
MNENNRSRRSQQARSSAADRRTPSAHPANHDDHRSNIYRYDARIQSSEFSFEDDEDDFEEENELQYVDIDSELEYEDDGDFLDSQGIQPQTKPPAAPKPYTKRLSSNRPGNRPSNRPATPAVSKYPNNTKPQPNRRPMEWQNDEPFDDEVDDPIFDEAGDYDEYDEVYDTDGYQTNPSHSYRRSTLRAPQPVQIIFGLVGLMIVGLLLMSRPLTAGLIDRMARSENERKAFGAQADAVTNNLPTTSGNIISAQQLSPFFSQSVLYWESDILQWASRHNLDPNMVATVMQIESCGDPRAQSGAGAMGLFQVMPFHFQAGEDGFDPDTNALRGMNYLAERLIQTSGEIGHAFAGYNGGQAAAASNWSNWANETQRYYKWTTGVYSDALNGNRRSDTLDQWITAGGASLCAQAEQRLGLQ